MSKPKIHHIDKRAFSLAQTFAGDNDELLTTDQLAAWLGVSPDFLEIGRHKGYGPDYLRLGPRCIRYTRGKVREWLQQRAHAWTGEYQRPRKRKTA